MGLYRKLKHKVECDDTFFTKAMITLGLLIAVDLIILYLIW